MEHSRGGIFLPWRLRGTPRTRSRECVAKRHSCWSAGCTASPRRRCVNALVIHFSVVGVPINMCQTITMARGWESKDVESQVEATQTTQQKTAQGPKSPEQIQRDQQRKDLQLSRTRVLNDLAAATHPNHRKSLEAALAHLDQKLSELR